MTCTSRATIHRLIRESGKGDLLDKLIERLDGHKASFARIIEIAEASPGDSILQRYAQKAQRGLQAIEADLDLPSLGLPYGSLGDWGARGHAPRIAYMLRHAERAARPTHLKIQGD